LFSIIKNENLYKKIKISAGLNDKVKTPTLMHYQKVKVLYSYTLIVIITHFKIELRLFLMYNRFVPLANKTSQYLSIIKLRLLV